MTEQNLQVLINQYLTIDSNYPRYFSEKLKILLILSKTAKDEEKIDRLNFVKSYTCDTLVHDYRVQVPLMQMERYYYNRVLNAPAFFRKFPFDEIFMDIDVEFGLMIISLAKQLRLEIVPTHIKGKVNVA